MSENIENPTTSDMGSQTSQVEQKEVNLQTKSQDLEENSKVNTERIAFLENELKKRENEVTALKTQVTNLEKEIAEAQKLKAQHLKESEEIELLKSKSEDTLTRAKGIIFEKTKVIKNQELQIEALNQQISSLKDVVSITKDLLEIRNLEIKQLESKIQCMEEKVAAEKERQDLMHKKLETMIRHNGELKREYETQLCLFSALRERYNERELARGVVDDLRADVQTVRADSSTNAAVNLSSPDKTELDTPVTTPTSTPAGAETNIPVDLQVSTPVGSEQTDIAKASITDTISVNNDIKIPDNTIDSSGAPAPEHVTPITAKVTSSSSNTEVNNSPSDEASASRNIETDTCNNGNSTNVQGDGSQEKSKE